VAFPIHLWTIVLVLRDFSWVTERTNSWDAVGVAAYGMVFAFFESVVITIIVALLGYLLPKQWSENKRIALLGLLFFVVSLWVILGQLVLMLHVPLPGSVILWLASSGHPLRWIYLFLFIIISLSVFCITYLFVQSEKVSKSVINLLERIAVLSALYLVFDVISVIILLVRNLA